MNNLIIKIAEKTRNTPFLLIMLMIAIPNFLIVLSRSNTSLLFGLLGYIFTFIYVGITYAGTRILKLDRSEYELPKVSETLIVTDDCSVDDYNEILYKGAEYTIIKIREINNDWLIKINQDDFYYDISYLKTYKYWNTKSDIRNSKLNKLIK